MPRRGGGRRGRGVELGSARAGEEEEEEARVAVGRRTSRTRRDQQRSSSSSSSSSEEEEEEEGALHAKGDDEAELGFTGSTTDDDTPRGSGDTPRPWERGSRMGAADARRGELDEVVVVEPEVRDESREPSRTSSSQHPRGSSARRDEMSGRERGAGGSPGRRESREPAAASAAAADATAAGDDSLDGREGDVELGEIVVDTNGGQDADVEHKEKETGSSGEDEERFCRICMEPVSAEELDTNAVTQLGCACVNGFIHYACATDYVKAKRGNLACEVCLEDMTSLEVVAKRLRDERRQHLQNRAAMLVLNGMGGRRGGAAGGAEGDAVEDAGDPAMVIDDPRWYRPGWGSRNPLVWVLWIITRPFALLYAFVRLLLGCRVTVLFAVFFIILVYYFFFLTGGGSTSYRRDIVGEGSEGMMGGGENEGYDRGGYNRAG